MKIMIVDDNQQNLYMLEVLLTANKYDVEKASNGSEALDLAHQSPPDLIISDILMPVMDGFALCRAWKKDSRLKKIPFIFYTATYTDPKDEDFALSLGAARFIVKPMEPERFLAVLQESIENGKAGILKSARQPVEEATYLKEYNAALVRKLEDKVLQLEENRRALENDIASRTRAEAELERQAEELSQRNNELARLYRASGTLISAGALNLHDLAQNIVEVVQQDFGQANCSLFLVENDSKEIIRLAVSGPYSDQVQGKRLSLDGPGLVSHAILNSEAINTGNVHTTPGYLPNWEAALSEMVIPLMVGNNVIGAIDLQSSQPNAFSTNDERLMTIFAERAALALEHGRLNLQTNTRMQQLLALRAVDAAISGSLDISLTLGVLLDQVIAQMEVDAADVLAFNPATQALQLSAQRGFRNPSPAHIQFVYRAGFAWRVIHERTQFLVKDVHVGTDGFQRTPDISSEKFVAYIGIPLIAKGQVKGVLEVFHREAFEMDRERSDFLEMLAGQAAIAMDNAELFDHLQNSNAELNLAYDNTLEGWAKALELRDKEIEGHTRRVTGRTLELARLMDVKENTLVHIYRGALLHDIGKMGLPDSIILKPGPLTDEEWVIMRMHPQYAYDLLSPIIYLRQALDIPYCHHEKWDGTGYPRGLRGEQIPISARIFAVVDVFDALTSDRPYRKAWTEQDARRYIREQSGTHFDPSVAEAFLKRL